MKEESLPEKLYKRRKQLDYSQEYMGLRLGITQSSYSRIETGETKITPELLRQLKSIEGFEDFDVAPDEEPEIVRTRKTIAEQWRWGKPLLYLTTVIVGAFVLSTVFDLCKGLYQAATLNRNEDPDTMSIIMAIYAPLGILFIRWIVFKKKW